MSNIRINALTATAVTPNYDDYFVIDGNTYGTRNILATTALSSVTGYGPMTFNGNVTVFGNISGKQVFDLNGNSTQWNAAYTYANGISSLEASNFTAITTTSANWNLAYNDVQAITPLTGNWNQSYTYFTWLTANSGNNTGGTAWQANSALVLGDLTNIATTSANWNLAYNGIQAITPISGNWNQAYTFTNGNSGNIITGITNVATNSAYWNTASGGNYLPLSGGSVNGLATFNNVVVLQSLSALSAVYLGTTITTSYSSLSVIDYGPGPALFVQENSSTGTIAQFNDTYGNVLFVGNRGSTTYNGLVGINVTNPGAALTVSGTLSTNAVINDATGTSTQWNTAYSYINSNSSNIVTNFTNIATTSANWNLAYTDIQSITPISATWNTAYTYTINNSAQLATIQATSANWNLAYSDVQAITPVSGNWNQAYTWSNSNSANLTNSTSNYLPLSGGTLTGALTSKSTIGSTAGFYNTSAFGGPYSDGIVMDYVTGNGRISVGINDNLSFYNGGPATTALVTVSSNGYVGINTQPVSNQTLTVGGSATFFGGISASNILVNGVPVGSGSQALIAGYSLVFGR